MRDYDVSLVEKLNERKYEIDLDGLSECAKPVPDDDRKNVLDPRVLEIAIRKSKRISSLKKGYSLSAERFRPDKISYDLTSSEIVTDERLININDDHMIDVFIYRRKDDEDKKIPVIIYFHGGGFTAGDHKLYENQMKLTCEMGHCTVIFPEYRLAPEAPYPAAFEDGYGTIKWAAKNCEELKIDPLKLMVAGDSAGGGILNACLLMDKDHFIKKAFNIYSLVDNVSLENNGLYAWSYDLYPIIPEQRDYAYSRIDKIKKPSEHSSAQNNLFLQGKVRDDDPMVSIVYADDDVLRGLPPMVMVTAEYDYLRISNEYLAKRLFILGNDIRMTRYDGCDHGFLDSLGLLPQAEDLCRYMADEVNSI